MSETKLLEIKKIESGVDRFFLPYISSLNLYQSVTSTNNSICRDQLNEKTPFQFCLAESQTASRGRLGRSWASPFAQNIYFSCGWFVDRRLSELSGLSLAVGLASVKALENYGFSPKIQLKWPNDLLFDGQKLGGILIETTTENGFSFVTIGIGLNVNSLRHDLPQVDQAWTSLRLIDQKNHDRNLIISHLINSLIEHLIKFTAQGFISFQKTWLDYDYFLNRAVTLTQGQKKINGKAVGVDEQGNILLEDEHGVVHPYSGNDISLRGSSSFIVY